MRPGLPVSWQDADGDLTSDCYEATIGGYLAQLSTGVLGVEEWVMRRWPAPADAPIATLAQQVIFDAIECDELRRSMLSIEEDIAVYGLTDWMTMPSADRIREVFPALNPHADTNLLRDMICARFLIENNPTKDAVRLLVVEWQRGA